MNGSGRPARPVAIVTGANHGIGAAVARRLAADGLDVLVTYLRLDVPEDPGTPEALRRAHARGAEEVLADIRAAGSRGEALELDLIDADAVPGVYDLAEERLGPVDVLVHCATGSLQDTFRPPERDWAGRRLDPVSAAAFDRQFGVDVRGGAVLIAELARRLAGRDARWGRIVTFTSGGERGWPGEVSYGAAKAALVNYTLSASLELKRWGVTANAVHPPVTDTGWVTDEVRDAVAHSDEFFSVADPEEVGELVSFLVSDAAARVTGNVIRMG